MSNEWWIDVVLLALLVTTAVAITRLRSLLATAMLLGIFSLLGACWMLLLDAPDVAFTEAAVGAGVSTIIFLATLCVTPAEEKPSKESPLALFVVGATAALLFYGTLDMPRIGDPESPANQSPVTEAYLMSALQPVAHGDDHGAAHEGDHGASHDDGHEASSLHATPSDHDARFRVGIPNTVTTVLASFRGYDTMGETAVVFTAGLGVVAILAGARHRRFDEDEDGEEDEAADREEVS